jgi:hypothetical protein
MTLPDAQKFVSDCIDLLGLQFDPEKSFSEYKDRRTGLPLYNSHHARECDIMLQEATEAFENADEDINEYCYSIL